MIRAIAEMSRSVEFRHTHAATTSPPSKVVPAFSTRSTRPPAPAPRSAPSRSSDGRRLRRRIAGTQRRHRSRRPIGALSAGGICSEVREHLLSSAASAASRSILRALLVAPSGSGGAGRRDFVAPHIPPRPRLAREQLDAGHVGKQPLDHLRKDFWLLAVPAARRLDD
jgi:hypothetical protein